jgi:hypothetical protein
MPEVITWTADVRVAGGPSMSASPSIAVDGYDAIEVVVDVDDVVIGVLPTASTARILMITASRYDASLTYEFSPDETVLLDGPQLFTEGMIARAFADTAEMTITNGIGEPVTVNVLVGRDG